MSTLQNFNDCQQRIVRTVWELVDALPHRDVIADADARGWIEEVVNAHGEAAIWHAIRLNGFGGSEIGVLVRNFGGERADHQASAHNIVESKLMRRAPLESTCHLRRGHENEDSHAQRFWAKYSAVRDQKAYDALKEAKGRKPWMRYSPDDMVLMPMRTALNDDGQLIVVPTPGEAHRWLIDYKAPSAVEENAEIAFQYACQLTQGAILCAENSVPIVGMMLSQFDWANWALKDDVLNWDEDVGRAVMQAGSFYWDYVTRGEVPPYIFKKELQGVQEYTQQYIEAAQGFAALTSLADAAKKRADEVRALLAKPIEGVRLGAQKITFEQGAKVLTLSATKLLDRGATVAVFSDEQLAQCKGKALVYDADLMEAHLRALGTDMKPFREHDLDATKVYAMAAALGFDPDALVQERLTMSPDKVIKGQMAAYIDEHYPLSAFGPAPGTTHESNANGQEEEALPQLEAQTG